MKLNQDLHIGIFKKRYKRFFADILLGDEIIVAHTANTGAMTTCLGEDWKALVSYHNSPTRKLKYSLEMTHNGKTWIGVNTSLTNALAIEGIKNGVIRELQGYSDLKPEAKIGESRIDILLSNLSTDQCYVEVKNVTLVDESGYCYFPDSVSERGQKHLRSLRDLKLSGIRAVMLFIVQREDCHSFKIEQTIDLKYCELLKEAMSVGVEVLVYQCQLSPSENVVSKKLPIE